MMLQERGLWLYAGLTAIFGKAKAPPAGAGAAAAAGGDPPPDAAASAKAAAEALALRMPVISKALHFLVVGVHRAENLPAVDRPNFPGGKVGIDAYVQIRFANLGESEDGYSLVVKKPSPSMRNVLSTRYVQIRFANVPPVRTRAHTKKCAPDAIGPGLDVTWGVELSLPVLVPNRMNALALRVYDRDLMSEDDLVGCAPPLRFEAMGLYCGTTV